MTPAPQWEQLLANRGILGAAKQFGWRPDGAGWSYPVYDEKGQHLVIGEPVRRWKAFDSSANPKYNWYPAGLKDSRPRYYLLPGTLDAIKRGMGSVILASGEPDVLAYRSAGAENVLCWFGEGQTPATLAADLLSWGVRFVECAPDRDQAGLNWAQHIVNAIADKGIGWRIYELPMPLGSKYDINKLWIDCKFDPDCFWEMFITCNELEIKPVELKPEPLPLIKDDKGERDYPIEFYAAIERALNVEGYKDDGFSKPVRCPLHNDEHASAGWHREKHILHCFVCHGNGEWALAKDVAAKLNIRPESFFTQKPKPSATVKPTAPKQSAGKPTLLRTWDEGTDRLTAQLDGDVPIFDPLPLPFASLRALGGFAKHTGPGKMIAIIADTGHGKTSWIETVVDSWRRAGFNGVLWGPEWSFSEYVQRAVQRNGGPTYDAMEDHKAYLSEQKRGVPEDKRVGKLLTTDQRSSYNDCAARMKTWPGKLIFIEKMSIPIDAVIANMVESANVYKANGNRLAFAVLDYAQLVTATGPSEIERMNHIINTFKRFVVDHQLIGIVGSQMTKSDGRAISGGAKGDLHSMVNGRTDAFNLGLAISRPTLEDGSVSSQATCRVVKNSNGATRDVNLWLNTDRMSWHDVAQPEPRPTYLPKKPFKPNIDESEVA